MQMYELLTPLRRGGADPIPAGTTVPLSWDDGETLVRLGAAIRGEANDIALATNQTDRDLRRRDLLRQLADVSGVDDSLMVVVAPRLAGMYLMTVGDAGVTEIQPYDPAADPLTSDDPAVTRRHHLDALRDLDDLTYLAFDDAAAAALGGLVLLSLDAESGVVTDVTARSAAVAIVDPPVVEPATQSAPSVIEPADDDTLAAMTKAQLLVEAERVGADHDSGMTKAELVAAIVAKRAA